MQSITFTLHIHPIHTVYIGFHPTLLYLATSWLVPHQLMVENLQSMTMVAAQSLRLCAIYFIKNRSKSGLKSCYKFASSSLSYQVATSISIG